MGDELSAVTLAYTHTLHRAWRTALRMLPVSEGSSVLDVGSGLGVLAFELASNLKLRVLGVDIEPPSSRTRDRSFELLDAQGLFVEGSAVSFCQGDIRALGFDDEAVRPCVRP